MKIKKSELKSIIKECINEYNDDLLFESMTYDQLVDATKNSWPNRFDNTREVQTIPPKSVILKDGSLHLDFNYSSTPSKEGKSHQGRIIFYPDKNIKNKFSNWWKNLKNNFFKFIGKSVPSQVLNNSDIRKMNCKVTCDCKDFLYRFEVANHKKDASDIQHSNGQTPRIRNPEMSPGLCKHLLGTLKYLISSKPIDAKIED